MDLYELNLFVQNTMLNSEKFPYDTGQLHDNFFGVAEEIENGLSVPIMENKIVNYGKILENAPKIRYAIRPTGEKGVYRQVYSFNYKPKVNKHFRYIDRIIEEEVLSAIENEYGVRRI